MIRRTTPAERRTRMVTAALIGVAAATGGFTATVAMTPAALLPTASAAPGLVDQAADYVAARLQ
ncbi:MAG: hypothetical protein WBO08_05645 [Mycobacterium sp.]|nr:hypothetical protein [Mycobacterium sp.]